MERFILNTRHWTDRDLKKYYDIEQKIEAVSSITYPDKVVYQIDLDTQTKIIVNLKYAQLTGAW